jgi:hypothetical protein
MRLMLRGAPRESDGLAPQACSFGEPQTAYPNALTLTIACPAWACGFGVSGLMKRASRCPLPPLISGTSCQPTDVLSVFADIQREEGGAEPTARIIFRQV